MKPTLVNSVVLALISAIASVLVARAQQAPRNTQGAVGYEVLADRVNSLELQVELLTKSCAQPPPAPMTLRTFKPISLVGLTPLRRVPSKLEHLPQ